MTPDLILIPVFPIVYGLQSSKRVRSSLMLPFISFSTISQLVSVRSKVSLCVPSSSAFVTVLTSIIMFSSPSVGSFSLSHFAVMVIVPDVAPGRIRIESLDNS